MKYQLILQWSTTSSVDYDALISIENDLIDNLEKDGVDGHDFGRNELNIFIDTDNPQSSSRKIMAVLEKAQALSECRIAYREYGSENFKILWPDRLKSFSIS